MKVGAVREFLVRVVRDGQLQRDVALRPHSALGNQTPQEFAQQTARNPESDSRNPWT